MKRIPSTILATVCCLSLLATAQTDERFHWPGTGLTLPRLPEHIYGNIDSPVDVVSSIALLPVRNGDDTILTLIALRNSGQITDPADQARFGRGFLNGYFDGKVDIHQPPVPEGLFGRYPGTWLSFKDQRNQPGLAGTAAFVFFENLVLIMLDSTGDANQPPPPSGKLQYILKRLSYKPIPPPPVSFSEKLFSPAGIATGLAAVMMLASIAFVLFRRNRQRAAARQAAKTRLGSPNRPGTGRKRPPTGRARPESGPSRTYRR